ncbi:L-arabinitol 4-dehydrogenase [Lentinula detonsa]|uniref:L-arabinitol 4-dehydrogenase n=1 Tax=Lentinula detonsa TaxID=2804962 RepID=A0AA38Q3P8_9AGAR|nr:L-arabinitol 4-dehydrogenase [Lentinula detonsa]
MSNSQVANPELYDPRKVLDHPDFRVLNSGEKPSKESNIAAFYNPAHEIHLVEKPKPKPGPGQVLIHVRATGICGQVPYMPLSPDVHFWKHGRIGDSMIVTDECGSGHESAGEIVEVGEGVTQWKAGDRVAMEVGVPCSKPSCDACRTGRYNGCPDVVFFSTPPYHGTLTRWHVHPAQWLHRLPDNVSFEEGSLCEPLAVALAGIERAGLRLGDPVVICGAGPIGLVSLLSARAAGAEPIVITDLFQSRLDFAKSLVPGVHTVLIDRNATPKAQAEVIKKAAGGPLQLALECTGVESSIHTAIFSVGFGAKVFIIGVGRNEQLFPFMHLSANEIDVQFQYRYANQYPKAIRLIAGGLINIKPLVTHRFTLEEAVAAFHVAADPAQGAIKVQIQD